MSYIGDFTEPWDKSDVTFIVGGRKLYFNRAILEFHSTFFKDLFVEYRDALPDTGIPLQQPFELVQAMLFILSQPKNRNCPIFEENLLPLLEMSDEYKMHQLAVECGIYILATWPFGNGSKAIQAVHLAFKYGLRAVAEAFLPLAACRPLAEIDHAKPWLPLGVYAALLHAALFRQTTLLHLPCICLEDERGDCNCINKQPRNDPEIQSVLQRFHELTSLDYRGEDYDFTQPFGDKCDVTFVFDNKQKLYFNRGVLAFHSTHYFVPMFNSQFSERGLEEIPLRGKKFKDVQAMLFVLKGSRLRKPPINADNVLRLLELSDECDLPHVAVQCGYFLLNKWPGSEGNYIKGVIVAFEYALRPVGEYFLPLAACRPLEEIDEAKGHLPLSVFCALSHANAYRLRRLTYCSTCPNLQQCCCDEYHLPSDDPEILDVMSRFTEISTKKK